MTECETCQELRAIIDAAERALEGDRPSDEMLLVPVVKKAWDSIFDGFEIGDVNCRRGRREPSITLVDRDPLYEFQPEKHHDE